MNALLLTLLLSLQSQVEAIKTDATIGVAAIDLETGRTFTLRGNERFPMASVYKVPIALTLLHQVDQGRISFAQQITIDRFAPGWSPLRDEAKGQPVTRSVGQLFELMLGVSDNSASDVLMELVGGPQAVTRRMRELGIRGIRIDRTEVELAADVKALGRERFWNDPRDTSTPLAMAALLRKLHRGEVGLSYDARMLAIRVMTETRTGPKRLKAGLPADAVLAHKTGTGPGVTNDVGLITSPRKLVIVVFTKGSVAEEEAAIAEIARVVYDAL